MYSIHCRVSSFPAMPKRDRGSQQQASLETGGETHLLGRKAAWMSYAVDSIGFKGVFPKKTQSKGATHGPTSDPLLRSCPDVGSPAFRRAFAGRDRFGGICTRGWTCTGPFDNRSWWAYGFCCAPQTNVSGHEGLDGAKCRARGLRDLHYLIHVSTAPRRL